MRWVLALPALLVIGAACGAQVSSTPSGGASVPRVFTVVPSPGSEGGGMMFPAGQFGDERKVADHEMPNPSDLPFPASFPKSAGVPLAVYVVKSDSMPRHEKQVRARVRKVLTMGCLPSHRGVTPTAVRRRVRGQEHRAVLRRQRRALHQQTDPPLTCHCGGAALRAGRPHERHVGRPGWRHHVPLCGDRPSRHVHARHRHSCGHRGCCWLRSQAACAVRGSSRPIASRPRDHIP